MLEAQRQQIYSELSSKSKEELLDLLMKEIMENDTMKARLSENQKVFTQIAKDFAREKDKAARLEKENVFLKQQNEHLTGINSLRAKDLYGRSTEKSKGLSGEEIPDDPLSEDVSPQEPAESGTPGSGNTASSHSGTGAGHHGKRSSGKHGRPGRRPIDLSKLPHHVIYDFDAGRIEKLDRQYGEGNWRIPFWRHHDKVERTRPITYVETTYEPVIAYGPLNELAALPYPDDLLPGSILSNSLAVSLMYGKFALALPFARQIKDLETDGLYLTEQTVTFWAQKLAFDYLAPVSDYMSLCLKGRVYNQCDETTELVIRDGRAAGTKSFVWVHVTSELDEGPAIAVFCYEKSRAAQHLRDFYGEHSLVRFITCDGFSAYPAYAKEKAEQGETLTISNCFMHARRKYVESLAVINKKGLSQEQIGNLPESKALKMIGAIFTADARLKTLTAAERLKQRQKSVRPLVDEYFDFVHSFDLADSSLREKLRIALRYSVNLEQNLRVFLTDGRIPLDDGFTERIIRVFAEGRRAWLFNCTPKGAKAAMIYYTLIETARLNGANPYIYLQYLFEIMPKQAPFFADKKALRAAMPWSKKYRLYEKEELGRTMERYIPPDDEKPRSPRKVGKRKAA